MAYTFTTKPSPTYSTTGQLDKFGGLAKDGDRQAVNGGGNGMQTSDATGTPVTSPVALTTATKTINVPIAASKINFIADAGIKFSELSAFSNSVTIPSNTLVSVDVALQTAIYFQAATTANLSFWFNII
jgi:hypothetical protein